MSDIHKTFDFIKLSSLGLLKSVLANFSTVYFIITIGPKFIVLVRLNIINQNSVYPSDSVQILLDQPWLWRDLAIAIYLFPLLLRLFIDSILLSRCHHAEENFQWSKQFLTTDKCWFQGSAFQERASNCDQFYFLFAISVDFKDSSIG